MTAREYLEASARLAGVPASTAGRRIDALLETRKALEGNVAPQLAFEAMLLGLGRASHC